MPNADLCLLPNHWHFVMWPKPDGDLSSCMQQMTNTHVKRWKQHFHETGQGHLYQGRFRSFPVQTDEYYYHVVRYVERNPLRANLVARVEDWPWSSLARRKRRDSFELLTKSVLSEWPLPRPDNWLDHVNRPQTKAELAAIRRATHRGCPFGDQAWADDIAERHGLASTLRPRGRPRNT